jgi:hypothetical protein
MPKELVERLFAEFKEDSASWEAFASRERSFVAHGTEEPPGRAEIVREFVQRKLGADHEYWYADVIIKIRDYLYESQLTATQLALYRVRSALPDVRWRARWHFLLLSVRVIPGLPLFVRAVWRGWWRSRSAKK